MSLNKTFNVVAFVTALSLLFGTDGLQLCLKASRILCSLNIINSHAT